MSVVYRDENHDYYMVCKGADSHVIPVCVDSPYRTEISKQVNIFSVDGYRTLVYAFKKLTPKEFEQLSKVLHEAKVTVTDRENALEAAYNEVESGFTIVGATAVDDQLQDGVIDTVKDLRGAGIKVWVLTGDKEETAISISYKCGHLHPTMRILYLCEPGLASILQHCRSVLCCRMSPLQKSKIVNFVRKTIMPPPVTLAIGDGANDCSMIQEAHVGVGIVGREGRQAAYCSDYSFLHFRFLKKLLLFHGFNAYNRIAYTILYFFYKVRYVCTQNLIFVLAMFLFVWYTNFSPAVSPLTTEPLFSGAEITMYNTLVTSLPVIVYGIFEQIHKKRVLMTQPGIYRYAFVNI
ncbi:putative phospholipid-transporting ATPase IF [Thelohanellus kitauei]|uniref:Putative phospholipid-transporting ATPase IF n=1 Tax=Thelohanellus kitauei TaxID=669202 RepID=A0A0C2ICU2_THEKT|nr:putative phospholipid-transporting ATPase IF [Thelohanellus kitauei]